MTVFLPFYQGDTSELENLLRWIGMLGAAKEHDAVLCADAAVDCDGAVKLVAIAEKLFKTAVLIATEKPINGWPQGANALFRCTARHAREKKTGPWLFLEPDCIPLCQNWLDLLEKRYLEVGKPILGAIVPCWEPTLPKLHVSGCAIYPENFIEGAENLINSHTEQAFDLSVADLSVPMAANDSMFFFLWGEKGKPPTFREKPVAPGEFRVDFIPPDAVLFHRNKDGTLIELLKQKYFPSKIKIVNPEFIIVLPFCNKDATLQIENLKWMLELGQKPRYDCLLSTDHATIGPFQMQMRQHAARVFRNVMVLTYPPPKVKTWPQAPNWAFQQTANHMHKVVRRPWLWKEPDMMPLKADWIEQLQEEYIHCGKPFMGSVVPGMGHANGTAVYPANMPLICTKGMQCFGEAFDTAQASQMMPHCHDAIHLMQHVWGIQDGKPDVKVGEPIVFKTPKQVQEWIQPEAVTFHRIKGLSLMEQMRKMKNENRDLSLSRF